MLKQLHVDQVPHAGNFCRVYGGFTRLKIAESSISATKNNFWEEVVA